MIRDISMLMAVGVFFLAVVILFNMLSTDETTDKISLKLIYILIFMINVLFGLGVVQAFLIWRAVSMSYMSG